MCRSSTRRLPAWSILLLLAVATCGCTATRERSVARYELGAPAKVQQAPDGNIFKVKWASDAKGPFHSIPQTKRLLAKGEKVGFATDGGGRVIAVAGRECFRLDRLPKDARFCAWTYQVERETRLGRGLRTAGKAVGDAALTTGGAAALVAVEAVTAYAWDEADDDNDDAGNHDHHHGDGHGHPKPRPHPGKSDNASDSGE
jgi:hypothetical protein